MEDQGKVTGDGMITTENASKMYAKAMSENNVNLALMIEQKFGLDGWPPNIVSGVLGRIASGEDLGEAIESELTTAGVW